MDTLNIIAKRYNIRLRQKSPIEIPNVGRNQLAELFNVLGFKVGAEIGVYKGEYSEILCKTNPGVELYCIDSWVNYDGFHLRDMDTAKQEAEERLKPYNVHILHMTSSAAAKQIPDGSLDFVYIDGNHEFVYVCQDLHYWNKKVRPGGIVAGHDYFKLVKPSSNMHVISAVNGFTDAYKIRPWFILGTKAIVPGQIRDDHRSWMWVR